MGDVIPLSIVPGDGYHVEADKVLQGALGQLNQVLVIGWDKDGSIRVASSDGVPESLLMMEVAKRTLIDGYFED